MSRPTSPILLLFVFVIGLLGGAGLVKQGPVLSAQAAKAAITPPAPKNPAVDDAPRGTPEDGLYEQLGRQFAHFEQVNRTFEMVAKVVSPAVVHIVAEKTGRIDETSKVRHYEETGSGVIVRGDRMRSLVVLTNNHVIEGAAPARIRIVLQDGRSIHPNQVWLDPKADIAVLNLGREDLPAARLGDSANARVGSWVLALGSPFGLTHSVSQGIISARGRHMDELQDVENQDFLQTDAAINPGNSGGPLVNMKGEVIGINNSIASNHGGNEGVGFSIPINIARWVMNQLVATGRVTRGALGIDLHPEFSAENAVALGLDKPHGAWVDLVHPASPAAQAGLQNNDVILGFEDVEILDLNHLITLVSMAPIGRPVDLLVWRAKQRIKLRVVVGDRDRTIVQATSTTTERPTPRGPNLRRPDPSPERLTSPALGLEFQTLDEELAVRLRFPRDARGVVVLKSLPSGSPLKMLEPNDVIQKVNGQEVSSADQLVPLLVERKSGVALRIEYDRLVNGVVERRTANIP